MLIAPLLLVALAPKLPPPLVKLYAERDSAMRRKDVAALRKMLERIVTPDFTMTMMGTTQNRKEMIANAAAGFAPIEKIKTLKSEVVAWEPRLGGGTATMKSTIDALMKAAPGKKPTPISYSYTTKDEWRFDRSGWRLARVTEVKG